MLCNKERRIAFVVEADNAIGYSLCKKLVKKNYHVIVGVRDVNRGLSYQWDLPNHLASSPSCSTSAPMRA